MPLRGQNHSNLVHDESPYFDSLDDLDNWATHPTEKFVEVLKYYPSSRDCHVDGTTPNTGKLLVCHDYKGGYTELQNPSTKWYTFNYWSACDTFVYFSHHRVTAPPSGWVTAAHRQGVKILGTLIFEGYPNPDVLKLITGRLPRSQSICVQSQPNASVALSSHYARILADLAHQRGFDGYLLNFESELVNGSEEGRGLASWITILRSELQAKIGPHAQTIWYDNVIYTGSVQYQNKPDYSDTPFFAPSTGLFSDYHWNPTYLSDTVIRLNDLKPQDLGHVQTYEKSDCKTSRDVFIGVDIFGRSTWYKSSFGCHQALSTINLVNPELGVAAFAPGWSWDISNAEVLGKTWSDWFNYDKKLWVGPQEGETVTLPSGDGGPYVPISNFFRRNTPPNPTTLTFYTSFCPGTGNRWYVDGKLVLDRTENGWTDIQKQTSLGDLLWPQPLVQWDGDAPNCKIQPTIDINYAWNGSSCVWLLFLTNAVGDSSGWVPIQSLALTPGQLYGVTLMCNDEFAVARVGLKLNLSVKSLSLSIHEVSVAGSEITKPSPDSKWTKLFTTFSLPHAASLDNDILASIGLQFSYTNSEGRIFFLALGQMSVFPIHPPPLDGSIIDSRILWADFEMIVTGSPDSLPLGILTWDIATSFLQPTTSSSDASSEDTSSTLNDTNLPWTLTNPEIWLPKFLYFNIYAQPILAGESVGVPDSAEFMGTTGLDGRTNRFFVDANVWPDNIMGSSQARLYVQGVTDRGEVLPWGHCAFVDIAL